MSGKSRIYSEIAQLVRTGQVPQVLLPKATRVIESQRNPVGRPRVKDKRPTMATPAGHRLRCKAHGCRNKIGVRKADIVCSEKCRAELLAYVSLVKDILLGNIPAVEMPVYYRDRDSRWKKKKAA